MILKNKSILVTGSSSGIGRKIAEEILKEGGSVFLHGLREQLVETAIDELGKGYGLDRVAGLSGDIADPAFPAKLVATALKRFGKVDGLVNNAGISPRHNIDSLTAEAFEQVMAINLRAPMLMIQACMENFRKLGCGSIVNIGSINAHCGQPDLLIYSTSKGGLQTMTRNLGDAFGPEKIRVNQLNVGWTYTENEHKLQLAEGRPENWLDDLSPLSAPTGMILLPEQVAQHAVFWLSDKSAPVTGTVLEVEQYPLIGRNRIADN
ncbi:SDR family oxidoreductase [Kiloniella laminariae]|uniref:SDR family oxidoreductase n=1 Tax=Kiloniella laminariae TaxID=454162 RepID=A0ABT4LNP2_9PROT|nr:SDR family NAD(P)-dependent oxidoreductase [Kiloniella laminariae]MCZ4282724.1 SDR family oxidoreductase [Kiloniella laminariae]